MHGASSEPDVRMMHCAVVVNFYAPWCPWCQRLEPTWEAVTQEVHTKYPDSDGRIRYAKVQPTRLPTLLTSPSTCSSAHEVHARQTSMQPRHRVCAKALSCMMLYMQ